MKSLLAGIMLLLGGSLNLISQELSPYIKVAESTESISVLSQKVIDALQQNDFEVLGTYNPARSNSLKVIAFTRNDLKNTTVKVADRGALGAVLKVGLVKNGGRVTVSYTNPDYLLRAYLRDDFDLYKGTFNAISQDLKKTLRSVGNEFKPFGGSIKADKLKKYHYKIMMPYFTDPITLAEFSSFNEGLRVIRENLNARKGNTVEVYELVYPDKKVAVFGVGLRSAEDGESHFLPTIGVEHAAALPYEIILQNKEATMLHGKYRIALHWPDLTMGTFMKIMSTPGDIEDTLESICIPSGLD